MEVGVLDRISTGASLGAILDEVTRGIEAMMPDGTFASILLVEDDILRHASAPSLPAAFKVGTELELGSCLSVGTGVTQ